MSFDEVKQFSSDKIFKHIDKVHQWLSTGDTFPVTIELDMTNACNHQCPSCFGYFGQSRQSLDISLVLNVLQDIHALGGRAVTFTGGGEPLCHKDTMKAIVAARELGLDVALITNGSLLDDSKCDTVVRHCMWTRVSLDAATPAVFRRTHGGRDEEFDNVVRNIRRLVDAKIRNRSDCTIGVGYLTRHDTVEDMYAATQLCRDIGADYIQFRPFVRLHTEKTMDYPETDAVMAEIRRCCELSTPKFDVLYSQHKYENIVHGHTVRKYAECYGHHFATVISADRHVYICCHMRGVAAFCFGDLGEKSLAEIWSSKERRQACQKVDLSVCPPLCRCDHFNEILWNLKHQDKAHKNFL